MRLSNRDLVRLLQSVSILNADEKPDTLPARTNDCVRFLIATDILSFEAFGTANDYQGPLWYTPNGSVSNELLQVMVELVHEQPFWDEVIENRITAARRISDYMTLVQYKKTSIYNEFFRKVKTDRQLVTALHVSQELMVSVSLCRLGIEFTERDCSAFNLLTPHLVAAFRTARVMRRLETQSDGISAPTERASTAIVFLDPELSPTLEQPAMVIMSRYFGPTGRHLPAVVKSYVEFHARQFRDGSTYLPAEPLTAIAECGRLHIDLVYNSQSASCVLLLREWTNQNFRKTLKQLSPREMEVLEWVAAGKTDGDIAHILGISDRTVQKHLQHIFDKLGVENRTAATSYWKTI